MTASAGPGHQRSREVSGRGLQGITVAYERARGLRYTAEGATVEIRVTAKPGGRARLVAQVMKLATAEAVERYRSAWRDAFQALKSHLAG